MTDSPNNEPLNPAETEEPTLDGLRAWQAAVVRLWSASEDSFAELVLSWTAGDVSDPASTRLPWSARLRCGDAGKPGWSEDVQITSAASIPQALQKLWDRAKVRHGLFKNDPVLTDKPPTDFPADTWLTLGERALLDRVINGIKRSQAPVAFRLGYYPERRLRQRWLATLHNASATPPDGVIREVSESNLLSVLDALLRALAESTPPKAAEALPSPAEADAKALNEGQSKADDNF